MKQLTINEIIDILRAGNLDDPKELSNFLIMLSASLLTAKTFETEAEIRYASKWLELKKVPKILNNQMKEKSDKHIDKEGMLTEEYRDWKKMENANDAIEECIMSLKKKLGTINF